nr:MAG TPA: putative transcriptional regulator [Caudoviricetes sp.]
MQRWKSKSKQTGGVYMPRVKGLTTEQKIDYQKNRLAETCELLMRRNHVKKTEIADLLGVTPQAVSYQFRNNQISMEVFMCVVTLTNAEPEKIKELLTID